MRTARWLVPLALAVAACSGAEARDAGQATTTARLARDEVTEPTAPVRTPAPVFIATSEQLSVLDPATGVPLLELDDAVMNADTTRAAATTITDSRTVLDVFDSATGERLQSHALAGEWSARILSPDARQVVLVPAEAAGDLYLPNSRVATTINVVDVESGEEQRFPLVGNFEPEAISLDGRALFVIEYIPPTQPDRYQVRRLDLASGEVGDVFDVDKKVQPEMGGTARTQVMDPDGSRIYTLYTVEDPGAPPTAFVHVVDLADEWAFCLLLPDAFAIDAAQVALALSPDGRQLFVVDHARHEVAIASTESLELTDVVSLTAQDADAAVFAAVDDQTLHVARGNEILSMSRTGHGQTVSVSVDQPIIGLQAADELLYAVVPDGVALLDSVTGAQIRHLDYDVGTTVEDPTRPPAARPDEILCAC